MESYEDRETTGLLLITSILLHAFVLCALLLSYHVQTVLLTRQIKQAVPAAQGKDATTQILFKPLPPQKPQQASLLDNQTTQETQKQSTASAANAFAQENTPTPSLTKGPEQETQEQTATSEERSSTTIRTATPAQLNLPCQDKPDSIAIATRNPEITQQQEHAQAPRAYAMPRNPWYKTAQHQQQTASGQQPITLQQITKSFCASVQQERQAMAGQSSALSTHDMVSRSYETKVFNQLKKSVLVESKPISMHQSLSTPAEVVLTIDKTGKIIDFQFNHQLPKHILKAVEDLLRRAAFSTGLYPQFPRIFKQNTYRFSLPLQINVSKGAHSYRLDTYYRSL